MLVADIAHLLSPTPAPGEGAGDVAIFFNKQCERLRDEGLLDFGALCPRPRNTPHWRPNSAPRVATVLPADGQILPR